MHFEAYSVVKSGADVRDAQSFADIQAVMQSQIAENPGQGCYAVFGCSAHTLKEGRLPQRADLDAMTGDVPALLLKYDGHAALANSALIAKLPAAAKSLAGYDAESGWLTQNAFYAASAFASTKIPIEKALGAMRAASAALSAKGIAFLHAAEGVGTPNDRDVDGLLKAKKLLRQDISVFFQTMDISKALVRHLDRIGGCFEMALDGCFGSEDAALSVPYQNNPQNNGVLYYSQEKVTDFVVRANRVGLQIALHAIGDRAVEQALTAFEAARQDKEWPDSRHIIIHADLISEADLDRIAKLGITIALQPNFLDWKQEPASYLEAILGENRAASMLPLRALVDRGILISAGSDAPCTEPDPFLSIHNCVNHPNPASRLTAYEALKAHTLWAAKTGYQEGSFGTLSAGMPANFLILSDNPLTVKPEKLKSIQPVMAYEKGKLFKTEQATNKKGKKGKGPFASLFQSSRG